ncbi:hypothetical protein Z951_21345 [Streptomyces sp. PRh5]|nr:hypothetical protein Z951_21345 [Streptomyces sp. PRh5]
MRWLWFQIRVRSRSSVRQVCIQRSMSEFIRGMRMPVVTTFTLASAIRVSKAAVNWESRSRIRNFALLPAPSRSMRRLRPSCTIQSAVGCVVAPRIRMRLVACSMTAKTYRRAPVSVRTSK